MSKYEIGQKVTTPLGDGIVTFVDGEFVHTIVKSKPLVWFDEELKPYKTPHEKLIEMGFEIYNSEHKINITDNSLYYIIIHKKSKEVDSLGKPLTFDLWKIFAEYLEWLEEQK